MSKSPMWENNYEFQSTASRSRKLLLLKRDHRDEDRDVTAQMQGPERRLCVGEKITVCEGGQEIAHQRAPLSRWSVLAEC